MILQDSLITNARFIWTLIWFNENLPHDYYPYMDSMNMQLFYDKQDTDILTHSNILNHSEFNHSDKQAQTIFSFIRFLYFISYCSNRHWTFYFMHILFLFHLILPDRKANFELKS